jgi:peptidoglycan/LPS O-acetylase OafA/YrhL
MESRSLRYMPALDGLRAVAVGLVFYTHAVTFQPGFVKIPGGLGVDVFFVLSGYLITRILWREAERTGGIDLPAFYLRRLMRLYPALLLMLAVVLLLYVAQEGAWPADRAFYALVAATYTSNIYMTVTGAFIDPFAHTWSLAMEEQFYLVFPLVLLGLRRVGLPRQRIFVTLAALAVVSLAARWWWEGDPFHPLLKAGGLLAGCALALAPSVPWARSAAAGVAGVAAVAAVVAGEAAGLWMRDTSVVLLTAALMVLVPTLAEGVGPASRALSARWIVHLGVISYGIYLWHYPILYVLRSVGLGGWPLLLVGLVTTLAVCEVSWRFVEQPVLRLKERIRPRSVVATTGRR